MHSTVRAGLASVLFCGVAIHGHAQTPLSELLPRLLSESVTMPSTTGTVAGNPHEAHFLPAAAQLAAPYGLNASLVTQLATFPIGSSSGGFTYSSNAKTGIPERNSDNFGPAFAERALTNGAGRFTAGFNYQRVKFDRFEGQELGGIRFFMPHNDCCLGQLPDGTPRPGTSGPSLDNDKFPFFEGDVVQEDLSLSAKTSTLSIFGTYGVSRHLDIGIAIPIVSVDLSATMTSTILRLATANNAAIHRFPGASPDVKVLTETGSSSGIGDVVARVKYNVMEAPGGGIALGLDFRLPTGDQKELRGTGGLQTKMSFYYSADYGRVSPHVNLGYTASNGSVDSSFVSYKLGDQVATPTLPTAQNPYAAIAVDSASPLSDADRRIPDEINYTAGVVIAPAPKVTLNADVVGRTLRGMLRFNTVQQVARFRPDVTSPVTAPPPAQRTLDNALNIENRSGNMTLLLGVVGAKLNVTQTLLVNASVLFPLSNSGLRPKPTPVIGIDYAF